MTRLVGSTLNHRYEIAEKLGEGGMAIVYRAKDLILGRRVALKVLRPQFAADTDFVERFRREAQAAASLSHPNVVNIFDVGTDGEVHYIVMEYVEGRNLKQILRRDGPLPLASVLSIGKDVCRALEAAHRQGLIHRDIKPHNILLTNDFQVKVTDFGIARAASTATLTQTGTVIGSVHYLSPEQATGGQVGVYSDIYAVGVLLYELLTGRVPFDGESPVAVALKHLHDQPPSLRAKAPDVPEEVERIILRAMAKEPSERYTDISAMLADLKSINLPESEGKGPRQVKPTPVPPPVREQAPGRVAERLERVVPADPEPQTDLNSLETTIVRKPKEQPVASPANAGAKEEQQVPPKKEKKRSLAFRLMLWLVVFLSFASGAVWAGVSFFERLFPEDVVVPSIMGMNVDDAKAMLKEYGLGLRVVHETNSDQPVNTIVRQSPEANRKVKMGREIEVHISVGMEIVEVPDLLMLSEREAELRIVQNGLELGSVSTEYRPDMTPNLVVDQEPAAGARVQRGTRVSLVFSTGAAPVAMVEVPDFSGVPLSEAIERVKELGLVLGETFAEVDNRFQPGQVTDQAPSPGTEVEVGTAVNFVYYPLQQAGSGPSQGLRTPSAPSDSGDDGDTFVRSLITIHVPPGPEQEVEIVIIDNISARRVYHGVHRGDARISQIIMGRGKDAMYQVWIGGELHGQGLIAEAR